MQVLSTLMGFTKLGGENFVFFLRKAEKAKIEHQSELEKLDLIKFKPLIKIFYSTTKQGAPFANYYRLQNILLVTKKNYFKRTRHLKQKIVFSFSSLETDANHQTSLNHHHVTQSNFWKNPLVLAQQQQQQKRK